MAKAPKVQAMEQLSNEHPNVGTIANLSSENLRVMVFVLIERIERIEAATKLQAAEYERRLEDLNHAHAEAKDVLNTYVTRELYDRNSQQFETRLKGLESFKDRIVGGGSALDYFGRALWALAGGVIGAAFMFLLKGGLGGL